MPARPTSGRDKICVAQIGAAHGLRGEVRLRVFTADPQAVTRYGALETPDGRRLELKSIRPARDVFVARFRGVDDRETAEALRNRELYVSREQLPPPADDEFYHADLIGLTAVTKEGEPIGEVVAIHNFGAGDIVELRLGAAADTVMLPFTEVAVPQIDIAGGRIVVDPPEGWLDSGPGGETDAADEETTEKP